MSSNATTTLASLLSSSSFLLAYTLPLLFLSLLLAFAGAFLTLDRTRAFAPRYDALRPPETTKVQHAEIVLQSVFRLEGGIGGIAVGFVTGVHLSTFLSLLIPNVTSMSALGSGAFLAVWLLSAIASAVLAARWKIAALAFAGLAGYSTLALGLSVMLHPSLLTRLILVAIFSPIGLLLCLLPIVATQHTSVRIGMSAAGAFGTVQSIALLAHIPAWTEVWDRLWVSNGSNWGTAQEKGLTATFCLFLLLGTACDWFLRSKFGENPDQKWDSYLADYANTLPNSSDRAGQFQPLQSFWARHFGRDKGLDPIDEDVVFPTDADLKLPIPDSPLKLYKKRSLTSSYGAKSTSPRRFTPPQDYLRKERRPGIKGCQRTREAIKFDPLDPYAASDSDDDDLKNGVPTFVRSPTRTGSMATLTEERPSKRSKTTHLKKVLEDPLSDDEQDLASLPTSNEKSPKWTPEFIRRHSLKSSVAGSQGTASSATLTPTAFTPVPATASLIRAVERVNAAQQAVYTPRATDGLPFMSAPSAGAPLPASHHHGRGWDAFWSDVKTKAGHGFHHDMVGGSGPKR
ncbi:uncharacterized protein BXZ73DRAFT_56051 [Epithele typhae]|uniref:uncharacterized protein n=1 Tax=Epithele typhae TaxID=378194 RepID=UPI00200886BA|nr:uncharacterized protein BXZ73DRAFT_56051 [Epithele typhae]KAH9912699.1 hypothetical protein BXZ73DRAFT_56051 [Epithele typhae]